MRFIGTKTHGMVDYLMGVLLIAAPWIFNFYRGGAETWVPVALGAGMIVYSLLTDYELGAIKTIPMRTHLILDIVAGVFLALSPWIFNFDDYVTTPHVIFGILEIGAGLFTKTHPATERSTHNGNYSHGPRVAH
jgi:hypothetical protein